MFGGDVYISYRRVIFGPPCIFEAVSETKQKGPISLSRQIGSQKKFNLFPIESYYQVLRTYIQPYQSHFIISSYQTPQ